MTAIEQRPATMAALGSRPLFVLNVEVSIVHMPGGPSGAERRIGDIAGGTFAGERLSGIVLPGGTDWQILRSDGAVLLDARILLRTDDQALIAMSYTGIRHGPSDVMARIARGEEVEAASYYFRIAASFATSAPAHEWLNRVVAVGTGHRLGAGPVYTIFEIL